MQIVAGVFAAINLRVQASLGRREPSFGSVFVLSILIRIHHDGEARLVGRTGDAHHSVAEERALPVDNHLRRGRTAAMKRGIAGIPLLRPFLGREKGSVQSRWLK